MHGTAFRCFLILTFFAGAAVSDAATLVQQRTELDRVGALLRSAERFVKAKRPDEAAAAFSEAQKKLQNLAQEGVSERLERTFTRATEVIAEQHVALTEAGVKLPELAVLDAAAAIRSSDEGDSRSDPDPISFAKDIAPMLAAKCGTCHIDQTRGTLSMATYAALMQGSRRGGRVIAPGEGVGSVIVDKIDSGDMPRGDGPRVTPEELAALVRWINQGAKFDGPNRDVPLRSLSAAIGAAPTPMPTPMPRRDRARFTRATGKETVSFALEIAPILTGRCDDCHGGDNTSGNLSLATFTRLLEGGDSGAIVGTADPEESLLIRKLRGTAGQRMPLNRPPLSDEQIALIAMWIREGSKFDGPDPEEPLERTTAVVRAGRASSDELSQIRAEIAAANWQLALPDETSHQVATHRFLLVGDLPEQQLREWGDVAELQAGKVLQAVRRTSDDPLSKARVTLFVFGSRIDFSEFATMVQRRELGKGELGNWAYDIVDAYACLLPTVEDTAENELQFAQQIAAIYYAERGQARLPTWFVEGAARNIAAKLYPKTTQVNSWGEQLPSLSAQLKAPDDFLRGKTSPEATGVLSYAFVGPLMRNARTFDQVIQRVAGGETIDAALKQTYRYDAAELAKLWLESRNGTGR